MFLFMVNLWICFLLTGKSPHAAHFSLLGYLTYKEVFLPYFFVPKILLGTIPPPQAQLSQHCRRRYKRRNK